VKARLLNSAPVAGLMLNAASSSSSSSSSSASSKPSPCYPPLIFS
jgi:hypothetical protein